MTARTSALLALLAIVPVQGAPPPDWGAVLALGRGSEIRVDLRSGREIRGYLQSAAAGSLVIAAPTARETLASADIRRVRIKRAGHRGRNTLLGLAIGAAGGLIAGAIIDYNGNGLDLPNAAKIVLGPFGAVIGTVVGVAMPTGGWRQVYRAP